MNERRRAALASLSVAFATFAAPAALATLAACGLGLTGDLSLDAVADAGADTAVLGDGAPPPLPDGGDAGGDADGGLVGFTPVVIASGGAVAAPTGHAQQTHLVYAEHAKRWWLFTIDSAAASALETYSSADFVTWTPGASLALPFGHANAGGNFSVAYADLGGHDVIHLAIGLDVASNDKRHYHARATIAGATIAWEAPAAVVAVTDPVLLSPDGCSVTVTSTGSVVDATGWALYQGSSVATGNEDVFVSVAADDGTTWTGGFGARKDVGVAVHTVNTRLGIAVAAGSTLLMWESADQEPDPTNVRWSLLAADGTFSTAADVFTTGTQGWSDWAAARVADTDVHAVRRQTTGTFDHLRWDGATWRAGETVPALAMGTDRGLVLLHDASRVMLVAIASDAASSVMTSTWTPGSSWGAWTTLAGATAVRTNPSGFTSPTAGSAVVWTETAAGVSEVVGQRVAF